MLVAPLSAPKTAPHPPLRIFRYTSESNLVHVFAQLISMQPEFFLMQVSKSLNFYQNKPKIKLFLQKKNVLCAGGSAPRPPMASG